uniref:Hexosyltransferase n=2 Tax=Latimeria chalumnae TaxID=7897 RepID=H3B1P1_LATCH
SLFGDAFELPDCKMGLVLVILVTSAPWNAHQRSVIRDTWASPWGTTKYPWQVAFLIGRASDGRVPQEVLEEKESFEDIVLGNYVDTYRNLTLKVMHGLKWAAEHCRPQYILKTDDDCFVNTDRLPQFLVEHNTIRSGLYVGSLFAPNQRHVIREPLSKWYVSEEDFRPDFYPPYASGVGYILSLDTAQAMLQVAELVRPIPVEDAYVGILAEAAGIVVKSSGRFAKHNMNWRVCNYRYLMVIHHLDAGELRAANE